MQKKNSYLKEYIRGGRGYSLVFLVVFMCLGCLKAGVKNLTPLDFMFLMVKGFSYQKFQITELLYYLFYFIFPIFWVNVFMEREKKERNTTAKFRYGSRVRWEMVAHRECLRFLLRYYAAFLLCILVADAALAIFSHDSTSVYYIAIQEQYGVHGEEIYVGFVISYVWRLVELLLLLEMDFCLYRVTGNTLAAFLGSFAVYLVGAVLRSGNVLIAGLSAAYGVFELLGLGQGRVLVFNILAGIALVFLCFLVQRTATGKLRDVLAKG